MSVTVYWVHNSKSKKLHPQTLIGCITYCRKNIPAFSLHFAQAHAGSNALCKVQVVEWVNPPLWGGDLKLKFWMFALATRTPAVSKKRWDLILHY